MTVDDLLDGNFMDGSEDEEEDILDQVSPEILHFAHDDLQLLGSGV
jgi:hypothetical protein